MKRMISLILSLMVSVAFVLPVFATAIPTDASQDGMLPNDNNVIVDVAESEYALRNDEADPMLAPDEEIDNPFFDQLRYSHIVMDETAYSNGNSSWIKSFDTTKEDPTYRVWVYNTGSNAFQIYVKRTSASSQDIMAGPITLNPGAQIEIERSTDNAGNTFGRRWVVLNPIGGNSFSADVRVRIAPSFDELG